MHYVGIAIKLKIFFSFNGYYMQSYSKNMVAILEFFQNLLELYHLIFANKRN
jgi:hypothetical protein